MTPERYEIWKRARQSKDGKTINEATTRVFDRIEKAKEDETIPRKGRHDVLTHAIGTEEHGGQARTGGSGHTISSFFGRDTSGGTKKDREIIELNQEVGQMKEMVSMMWRGWQASQGNEGAPSFFSVPPSFFSAFPPSCSVPPPSCSVPPPSFSALSVEFTDPTLELTAPLSTIVDPIRPFPDVDEGHYPCDLMAECDGPIIAHGTAYIESNPVCHTIPLKVGEVQVSFDYPAGDDPDEHACVVLPIKGNPLRKMFGCFTVYPCNLVLLKNKEGHYIGKATRLPAKRKNISKEKGVPLGKEVSEGKEVSKRKDVAKGIEVPKGKMVSSESISVQDRLEAFETAIQLKYLNEPINRRDLHPKMRLFVGMAVKLDGKSISIHFPIDLFCRGPQKFPCQLGSEDLLELLNHGMLQCQHIQTYIRFLSCKFIQEGLKNKYRFLCPQTISYVQPKDHVEIKARHDYMMNTFKMDPNALFFAPFNFDKHWVLVVIAPSLNCAVWFDSLGKVQRKISQDVVNTCLRAFVGEQPTTKKKYFWVVPKCPKQNDGVSCGYFVLRYMRTSYQSNGSQKESLLTKKKQLTQWMKSTK